MLPAKVFPHCLQGRFNRVVFGTAAEKGPDGRGALGTRARARQVLGD